MIWCTLPMGMMLCLHTYRASRVVHSPGSQLDDLGCSHTKTSTKPPTHFVILMIPFEQQPPSTAQQEHASLQEGMHVFMQAPHPTGTDPNNIT